MSNYDVIIIGAGVIGGFVARHLKKTELSVAILEKNTDVCTEVTRANSAIVHSGINGKPGSLKARLTAGANANFHNVCDELNVEFRRCGSLMVATCDMGMSKIHQKLKQGFDYGVKGLTILNHEETVKLEPNLNQAVKGALFSPSTGIVNPWELGIAAIENAMDNGARLFLNEKVTAIKKQKNSNDFAYNIQATSGVFRAKLVVNCAGLYADEISDMVCGKYFTIIPNRGEYLVLDTYANSFVKHVIFTEKKNTGEKGIVIAPTVQGNIIVGPTTMDVSSKESFATTTEGLKSIVSSAAETVQNLPTSLVIRSFAGLRPNPVRVREGIAKSEHSALPDNVKDFIVEEAEYNFVNVAGIKTPGLTCADELGKYVADMIIEKFPNTLPNLAFNPKRRTFERFANASESKQAMLIRENNKYGEIICRCRSITEAEIIDAIYRNTGATTIEGVKRRAGTCLGRCQGSYCGVKIAAILSRELGNARNYGG